MKAKWWNIIRSKYKNMTVYVFLILFGVAIPFAMFTPAQTEKVAVVTTLGIDKNEQGQLEVSVLTIAPSGSATPENQTLQLYSAVGEDVSQCMLRLSLAIGKEVGLAHCDSIVIDKTLLEEGITQYLDYFVRSSNLISNAFLICCPSGAKELLQVTTSEKNDYNLSLRSIIFHLDDYMFTTQATLSYYYEKLFSQNPSYIMPIIDVKDSKEPTFATGSTNASTSEEDSASSSGSSSNQQSSQGQSSSGEQNQKTIKSEGKSLVLYQGKLVKELTQKESYAMNILAKTTSKGILMAYDVTTDQLQNAKVTMKITNSQVQYQAKFLDGKPVFHLDCHYVCSLDSIVMGEYELSDYQATTSYLDSILEDKIKENIFAIASTLLNNGKSSKIDYLESYRYFEAYHPQEWKEYRKKVGEENYLDSMLYTIDITIDTKI